MNAYKTALTNLCLAASLSAANAMADTANTHKDNKGVHTEIRDGANETPATNKGKGTGLLGGGPIKENPEDVKPGKSEKMNDTQGETARFTDKNKDAAQ